MAKKGKRGGFKTRTRTIVKYRTRAIAVARRARHHGATLAKERAPVALFGAILGYADAKRDNASDSTGQMLAKIPSFGSTSWLATVGVVAHFYSTQHKGSKTADRLATAALTLAAFKLGRATGGVAGVGGNGQGMGVWMGPPQQGG